MVTLARIFVYPIKSTAPVELAAAEVEPQGLAHDRRYVVTDARGRFVTARRFPRMVLVQPTLVGAGLSLAAPGSDTLRLDPPSFPDSYDKIRVWRDEVDAQRCTREADEWFTRFLGIDARLYFMGEHTQRPRRGGGKVSFADAAELLVLSAASVADLNTRLETPVGIRNFRPNLVVSGSTPYAEDDWPDFQVGTARLRALWRCSRCVLTTVDPDTGRLHPDRQPLETLMQYRRDGEQAMFGLNVGVARPGRLRVGDAIEFDREDAPGV